MWIINLGKCVFVCNRVHPTTLLSQSLRVWLFDRGTSETQTPHEWFMRGRRDRGIREERKHYRTTHTKQHETHKLYVINTVYHFSNASMKWAAACIRLMDLRSVRRVCLNTIQHMHCKHKASDTPSLMADLFRCSEHPLHSNLCQRSSRGAHEATIHPSIHPSLCADDHCLWYYSHYQKVETEVSH